MAGRVGPGGGGVAGRVGSAGGKAGRGVRLVGWYWPVAEIVHTGQKGAIQLGQILAE